MVSPNFIIGFVALVSLRAVSAGACRPKPSSTLLPVSDTTLIASETSLQTLAETSSVTIDETSVPFTTVDSTIALTTAETTIETSFATEDDATTTVESSAVTDFTTDITTFITLTADTTTEVASTATPFVPADLFPCTEDSDCDSVTFCDATRCGCVNGFCKLVEVVIEVPVRRII
ncbi:hypothetical protein BKA59DRAFT_225196 [Fusarium tricinctum]|uniref:Extracellular membrane protein CFEM domain-containing protein n=2 Tax=Fusarium tricinctum species complex TaxID=679429 RepID=A0A8K0W9V7_9HYPO|nr:hypothetical protein BKA59DRAFT_225196 [Fusarium tricinctum]